MDKMMSREFFECLFDNQRVKIINKYCDEMWMGKAKDIPGDLKKREISVAITTEEFLVIQTK